MSKISNLINMNKSFLEKLSKSELIELLLQKNETIILPIVMVRQIINT